MLIKVVRKVGIDIITGIKPISHDGAFDFFWVGCVGAKEVGSERHLALPL